MARDEREGGGEEEKKKTERKTARRRSEEEIKRSLKGEPVPIPYIYYTGGKIGQKIQNTYLITRENQVRDDFIIPWTFGGHRSVCLSVTKSLNVHILFEKKKIKKYKPNIMPPQGGGE